MYFWPCPPAELHVKLVFSFRQPTSYISLSSLVSSFGLTLIRNPCTPRRKRSMRVPGPSATPIVAGSEGILTGAGCSNPRRKKSFQSPFGDNGQLVLYLRNPN